jgi:hypothetical protein
MPTSTPLVAMLQDHRRVRVVHENDGGSDIRTLVSLAGA